MRDHRVSESMSRAGARDVRGDAYAGRRTSARRQAHRKRRGRITRVLIELLVLLAVLLLIIEVFDRDEQANDRQYPLKYREWIELYAREQELEPAYIAAIIFAESSYNPLAVSSANAQGLMQILPSTGEWIAGKLGETYEEGCLLDAQTNIRYGCWYMGFLMRRYDGDKACSSAAYHSGQGTVDGWLKNVQYSADGRTLSTIPGTNADTYVKRVLKYYEYYVEAYQKAEQGST